MSTPDARDLLRALVPIDRCVAVWCAAQCARTALRCVPEGELRPLQAIEAAEAWAREPTKERRLAAKAAYAADAADAADAAVDAAYAAARKRALSDLHALCLSLRWPLAPAPTAQLRHTLPAWQQVAWDEIESSDLPAELTVEQLLEAHTHRGALPWQGAGRALAERLVLAERLRSLGCEVVP